MVGGNPKEAFKKKDGKIYLNSSQTVTVMEGLSGAAGSSDERKRHKLSQQGQQHKRDTLSFSTLTCSRLCRAPSSGEQSAALFLINAGCHECGLGLFPLPASLSLSFLLMESDPIFSIK